MNTLIYNIIALAVIGIGTSHAIPLDGRVIGGSEAQEGQFPFMVSLRFDDPFNGDMHMCGGTIINSRWIITAAHCVVGRDQKRFYIKAGTNSLSSPGVIYQIQSIIPHPAYEPINILEDLALIKLLTPITFTATISALPLNTSPLVGGELVVFGGWGSTAPWGPPPDQLQCLAARVVPEEECRRLQQPYPVTQGMICTYAGNGRGACHGDSGSFLVGNGSLVGVVSWGRPCAIGFPDVFTRVSWYKGWIDEQMENN